MTRPVTLVCTATLESLCFEVHVDTFVANSCQRKHVSQFTLVIRFSVLCSSSLLLNALQELGQAQVSYLGKTLISQSFVFIYPGSFP